MLTDYKDIEDAVTLELANTFADLTDPGLCRFSNFDTFFRETQEKDGTVAFLTEKGGGQRRTDEAVGRTMWEWTIIINAFVRYRGDPVQLDKQVSAVYERARRVFTKNPTLSGLVKKISVMSISVPEPITLNEVPFMATEIVVTTKEAE